MCMCLIKGNGISGRRIIILAKFLEGRPEMLRKNHLFSSLSPDFACSDISFSQHFCLIKILLKKNSLIKTRSYKTNIFSFSISSSKVSSIFKIQNVIYFMFIHRHFNKQTWLISSFWQKIFLQWLKGSCVNEDQLPQLISKALYLSKGNRKWLNVWTNVSVQTNVICQGAISIPLLGSNWNKNEKLWFCLWMYPISREKIY